MAREVSYDYFWNSNNDRYYSADSMGDWLRPFFKNGVFNGQLQVTANNDMSVTIADGYGYINGKHRHFLNPTTLDLEIASGTLDRIDAVILRRNDTERRIHLLIVTGGNAKSPVAPELVRSGAIYDLKLAEIYIAAGTVRITQAEITDTRMNSAVCGWVAATVDQIKFEQITAQFDAFFAKYQADILIGYTEYLQHLDAFLEQSKQKSNEKYEIYLADLRALYREFKSKGQQDYDDFNTEITAYIDDLEDRGNTSLNAIIQQMTDFRNINEAEFLKWFETLKGLAGVEEIGQLLLKIKSLESRLADVTEILYSGRVDAELIADTGDNIVDDMGNALLIGWLICKCNT